MSIRYADMERKLGEIDRSRAIYVHCSQMCDPKVLTLCISFFIIDKMGSLFKIKIVL